MRYCKQCGVALIPENSSSEFSEYCNSCLKHQTSNFTFEYGNFKLECDTSLMSKKQYKHMMTVLGRMMKSPKKKKGSKA